MWLRKIKIYNNHESGDDDNPEIYTRTKGVILSGYVNKKLKKCNTVGYLYTESNSDWLHIRIYPTSGEYCASEDPDDYAKVHYRVKEEDTWPNPDDKVAQWRNVWSVDSMIALDRDDCDTSDGWEDNADIWVGSYDTNP